MSSAFGKLFTVSTWGESHGKAVGAVVDGCPAGLPLCEADIQKYLDRRRPGQNPLVTPRDEADKVEIFSGVFKGKTTGTPISLLVKNEDQPLLVGNRDIDCPCGRGRETGDRRAA